MTIGAELQAAREQHGLTLGEISSRTKIRVPVLRAIENDDFAHAPGGVIMRGFLKLYAREVGLNPDDIARRFHALQANGSDAGSAPAGQLGLGRPASAGASASDAGFGWRAAMAAAAVVAILGGYVMWNRTARPAPSPEPVPAESQPPSSPPGRPEPASTTPAVAASGSAPVAAAGSTPAATAPAATATTGAGAPVVTGGLRVDIRATDASWLAATADGQQIAYRMLNPGDRVSLSIKTLAVLRIGIPANVAVSINDVAVKPFGTPGQPATLRITPDNYRTLLP